jgi:hypothetical protein
MMPGRDLLWDTRAKDENGKDIFIFQSKAASYITDEFVTAMDVFVTTENMGCLPFAGGWAEQPYWITKALSVLKVERWKADEQERKENQREAEEARKR